MTQPVWVTESNLGTFLTSNYLSVSIVATPVAPATSVSYSIVEGLLPPGLVMNSSGLIQGIVSTSKNSTYSFIIKVTDNLGNTNLRQFYMIISYTLPEPVWVTPAGSLGSFPALVPVTYTLNATAQLPATTVTYSLISGSLPTGLNLDENGVIYGTPNLVTGNTLSSFTVRATDNLQIIKDRTFIMTITGVAIPQFTTPNGSILTTQDSIWIQTYITYSNPKPDNPIIIQVKEGILPPGLEINLLGEIRGYAQAPIVTLTNPQIITTSTETSSSNNSITVASTVGFTVGRPVTFSGTTLGGTIAGVTYYIKAILNSTSFTITATQNGPTYILTSESGLMTVTLPAVSVGNPTVRTYNFVLELSSPLGNDTANYSITVINQNTPVSQGGPGKPLNTRLPVIYNTRPPTFDLNDTDPYYGYYILPPVSPTQFAPMGNFESGEYFAWKMIGHDFDGNPIKYIFSDLPTGLVGDVDTGWITGIPTLTTTGISTFGFSVSVYKSDSPILASPYYNFTYNLRNNITGVIVWETDDNLGSILNGSVSTLSVKATSDVELSYRLVSGSLPPNLTIASNGEILGRIPFQPTNTILNIGDSTSFTFTVEAYSETFGTVKSTKTFTLTITQEFEQPTDILYIKAAPPVSDRLILETLLDNESLIPTNQLYRPNDPYFGKATSVIYEHAFGIYASDIQTYLEAITKNHYWRYITLGEIKTAIARNSSGEIIYEVVYSEVIDNLVNPQGVSIQSQIYWPRFIDLGLGPWYTSITDIYTSYVDLLDQEYYTSLTPGYARVLYPNSLYNMRNRVAEVVGQEFDSRLLPLWMTSQQLNGSTLGYTQAWVIAYTKPGYSEVIKNNIINNWSHTLNEINFQIDRFSVNKSATYDYNNNTSPASWTDLPSATPTPDPLDSRDFYVLFPRQTILPDETQYKY